MGKNSKIPKIKSSINKKVFVIHGRNEKAKKAMFEFLRSLDIQPIEWHGARKLTGEASPYIGKIVETALKEAQAIVALFTGDDLVRLREEYLKKGDPDNEAILYPQARPNVIFESGMAFGYKPKKTILVQLAKEKIKWFSDVGGKYLINMSNDIDARLELIDRLKTAGIEINNEDKREWIKSGDFDEAAIEFTNINIKKFDDKKMLTKKGIPLACSDNLQKNPKLACLIDKAKEHEKDLEFDKAIDLLNTCLDLPVTLDEDKVELNNLLGNCYFILSKYNVAEINYREATKISNKIKSNNLKGIAAIYNNLGNIRRNSKKCEDAEKYYVKALNISKKINNKWYIGNICANLGLLKHDAGLGKEEIDYFMRALKMFKETGANLRVEIALEHVYKYEEKINRSNKILIMS